MKSEALSDSIPILDVQDAINALGDEDLFNILVNHYDEALCKSLKDLRLAMDTFNYKDIRSITHALMGPSNYVEAKRVLKACETVFKNVDNQEGEAVYRNYPILIEECIKLRRWIRGYICNRDSKCKVFNTNRN